VRVGSIGDIGCFSFFPSKNLGAFGDAGLCTTQDPILAERMSVLRVHGGKPKYFHALIGGNFRIDELQAAVLRIKLKYLDEWTAGRQRNAAFYDQAFARAVPAASLVTPSRAAGGRHIFNQYVVRAERRDELRSFLSERHIGTEIYYPVPLHLQTCFGYLGYARGDFPESEAAASQTLALPIYPELSQPQKDAVVAAVAEFYAPSGRSSGTPAPAPRESLKTS
jgi:dTDP-4-amino-4,6-dideoxygalactose transaminase